MATAFQSQRFELKYILNEEHIDGIRDFLRPYLQLDPYGSKMADRSYTVHSLYLDSPDLALHQSTINGDRNRFKMRVRYYESGPDRPVYFEIKRREDNAIYKERCPVKRDSASKILSGRLPSYSDMPENCSPVEERALQNFYRQVATLQARPVTHVRYRREAWHGLGDSRIRVTIDRQVKSCPEISTGLSGDLREPSVDVFGNAVVLELKFTNRFPEWMEQMVRIFGLRPGAAAKYVDGILSMERLQILPGDPTYRNLRHAAESRLFKQLQKARDAFSHRLRPLS